MIKLLPPLILLATLSGCAFTVYDVNVGYKYNNPVVTDLNSAKLNIGQFKDSRKVVNPRMIMNQKNGYGQTTTGGWQAEKPLVEFVKEGVTDGLIKAKAVIGSSENMILSGELLSFDGDTKMGMWSGTFTGKITVKLQLSEKNSGKTIWKDTFVGSGEEKGDGGVESIVKISVDNLVDNILKDEYFIQKASGK